eukprot:364647-Chlamydomonas_euryale.AAC.28
MWLPTHTQQSAWLPIPHSTVCVAAYPTLNTLRGWLPIPHSTVCVAAYPTLNSLRGWLPAGPPLLPGEAWNEEVQKQSRNKAVRSDKWT